PGNYGLLHVSGDDPDTAAAEGARPGDVISFKLWSVAQQKEYKVETTVVTGSLAWADRAVSNVNLNGVEQVRIPLQAGWNLVSFPVAKVWHVGAQPTVPVPAGVVYQPVTSIKDVFASIEGKYALVRAFDVDGAKTFDPAIPTIFNDLNYVAGGYGYWIRMNQACELVINGPPLPSAATLNMHASWNLVGYWGLSARHVTDEQPVGPFPEGTGFVKINSILDIFGELGGGIQQVRSFDKNGAHVFDPTLPPYINDLNYMGPGFGYWIKLSQAGQLDYR
ncbi:MAG: hypothetical protein IH614_03935, partial [Desulfuromonadales bacterium]|nr:hypothetical protein [Desulfuromonadales bacterium]